jgi:hypothetical protein
MHNFFPVASFVCIKVNVYQINVNLGGQFATPKITRVWIVPINNNKVMISNLLDR